MKNKKYLQFFALVMAFLIVVSLSVSCKRKVIEQTTGEDEQISSTENNQQQNNYSETQNSGGQTASGNANTNTTNTNKTPSVDLGGRTIRMFWWEDLRGARVKYEDSEDGRRTQKLIEALNKKHNAKFTYVNTTQEQMYASILAGNPNVDIMMSFGPRSFPGAMKSKLLLALEDLGVINFNDIKWDKFVNDTTLVNGKHYGVWPLDQAYTKVKYNQVMFFNKSLLTRSGVTENLYQLQKEGKWTWDKMAEIAKKVTKDTNNDGTPDQWGLVNFNNLYRQLCVSNNSDFIEKTSGTDIKFVAGNPEPLKALNYFKSLAYTNKSVDTDTQVGDVDKQFWTGKYAFLPNYLQRVTSGYKTMTDDYGILLFPKPSTGGDYVSTKDWWWTLSIPKGTKEPEKVARYLDDFCVQLYSGAEENDILESQFEAYIRDVESMETIKMLNEKSKISYVFATGVDEIYWEVNNSWPNALKEIAKGTKEPAGATAEFTSMLNSKIGDVWKLN